MLRAQRRFTLIELLVVISIIILATAMAIPAVNKFTRGQGLENAGRLMQSAFNEARRAAITTRKPHYIVLFRKPNPNPSLEQFGLRAFQQGKLSGDGYTDAQYLLPASIAIQTRVLDSIPGLYGLVQEPTTGLPPGFIAGNPDSGCRLAVFNDCPYPGPTLLQSVGQTSQSEDWINANAYRTFFEFPAMKPLLSPGHAWGWLKFGRDGTAQFVGNGAKPIPAQRISDDSLYDRNINFPETALVENQIFADFTLRQSGEPKKRCYIDVDENTGRARYRVVQLNGYSGTAGGIGTTTDSGN